MIEKQKWRHVLPVLLLSSLCLFVGNVALASHTTSTSSKMGRNDIALPILFGVTLKDIVPDFGDPRGGGTRTHEGQDIMAPEGTPIVSPVKGTVLKFGTAANPGKYVYVKGADGYMYAFMHLDEIAKLKRGQKLKVGDLIGTVGETGNAKGTTPHLHFEIRKGKPIDPYTRLKKEFTLEEKFAYLNEALRDLKNDDALVTLMAERFSGVLFLAEAQGLTLSPAFTRARKKYTGPSLASTTIGLSRGTNGDGVKALQKALITSNMGSAAYRLAETGTTGYFGTITYDALLEFQKAFNLPQNGIFTEATKAALMREKIGEVKGIATTNNNSVMSVIERIPSMLTTDIILGERGSHVALMQTFLIHAHAGTFADALAKEGATGYFGTLTESALREYQAVHGISPTGMYDEVTRNYMSNRHTETQTKII